MSLFHTEILDLELHNRSRFSGDLPQIFGILTYLQWVRLTFPFYALPCTVLPTKIPYDPLIRN